MQKFTQTTGMRLGTWTKREQTAAVWGQLQPSQWQPLWRYFHTRGSLRVAIAWRSTVDCANKRCAATLDCGMPVFFVSCVPTKSILIVWQHSEVQVVDSCSMWMYVVCDVPRFISLQKPHHGLNSRRVFFGLHTKRFTKRSCSVRSRNRPQVRSSQVDWLTQPRSIPSVSPISDQDLLGWDSTWLAF